MAADIAARVARAFRVRGRGTRRVYVEARRLGRYLRDARRRALLGALPATDLHLPPDTGLAIVSRARWPEVDEIVADATRIVAGLERPPEGAKGRKRFLQNVLDRSSLTLASPLMRLALRDDLLGAVAAYLKVVPLLSAVSVLFSDTVDRDYYSSQLYHCDGDDVTQVKVFVYCTDVDQASGPLTILDAAATAAVLGATSYRFDGRLTDAQVEAEVGPGRATAVAGPAGTVVLVDTSRCLHFGSRVAPGAPPRLVAMLQFQTPYSFMSDDRTRPFRHLADARLPELQRLVLGA